MNRKELEILARIYAEKENNMVMKTIDQQKKVAQEIYKKLKIIDPYAILAGGAPRDWYFGNLANDLDFYFFSTGVTVSSVVNQLSSIMGVKVDAVKYDEDSHQHGQYKSMPFLRRVLEAEIEGEKVQFMQLTEPNAQFKVVDAMDVSICKVWCREDMSVQMHNDFKLTLASHDIFLSEGYNWSDKHPQKIADRFPNFHRSTKSKAVENIVKNALKGVGQ